MRSLEDTSNERKDRVRMQIEQSINVKLTSDVTIYQKVPFDLLTIKETIIQHVKDRLFVTI
jgi:hypothetical protein